MATQADRGAIRARSAGCRAGHWHASSRQQRRTRQLTVHRQLVQLGWELYKDDPTSDASGRTIALDADTVTALRTHRRQQPEDRMA